MGWQPGFFDVEDRLRKLSAKGDDLERIAALVDFGAFRSELERAGPRSDSSKGGRPAFGLVLVFKALLLQAMHALSDERVEYLVKDRPAFMRCLGPGLADPVPDANTIWAFREARKRAGAVDALFARFDATLREAGHLAMGGPIVDASIAAAPKQRDTEAEKAAIKAGRGLVSRIHRKKPKGRPMPARTRRANARKSAVRAAVEHVFARQKGPMALVVHTIGIARARVKIGFANQACNMKRFVWLSGRTAPA